MPGGSIQITNVRKEFESMEGGLFEAISNVSLFLEKSSFCTIVGTSGCGKTTLLRLIAGLEKASGGQITVDGEKIVGTSPERGLVFQHPKLFPWLNLYDNVAFGLRARGKYKAEKARVPEMIELVGLKGFEKSLPHHLSGGMQQRAALARALINNPKVLLLDEPLGALDSLTRVMMQDELIKIWQASNPTIVMVTHDVEEAVYLSDKVIVMSSAHSRVEKIFEIDLPRPRDRETELFTKLKGEILNLLNIRPQ